MGDRDYQVGFRPLVRTTAKVDQVTTMLELAEKAEAQGFDGLFVGDRLLAAVQRKGQKIYDFSHIETFTAMAALAARTSKIKLGTLVIVVPFRNPVQLAKITASLDLLSNGRLLLGCGAGWNEKEFEVHGFDKKQAARRMEESIEIMKLLWTGKPISYEGKYFQYDGIAVEPTPAQPGGPPIWLGSWLPFRHGLYQDGQVVPQWDRMLARVGRIADTYVPLIYSIVIKQSASPELLGHSWERAQMHAEQAGRKDKLSFAFSGHFYAIKTKRDEEHAREDLSDFAGTFEQARDTHLIGTPEEIVDKVRRLTSKIDRVSWYIFTCIGPRERQLELLHQDILPLLASSRH